MHEVKQLRELISYTELSDIILKIPEGDFQRYLIEYTYDCKYSSSLRVVNKNNILEFSALLQKNIAEQGEEQDWEDIKTVNMFREPLNNFKNYTARLCIIDDVVKETLIRLLQELKIEGPYILNVDRATFNI